MAVDTAEVGADMAAVALVVVTAAALAVATADSEDIADSAAATMVALVAA